MGKILTKQDRIDLFLNKIKINEYTDCWEWQGFIEKNGYGHASYKNKTIRAHQLSYLLFTNDIDEDLVICHSCNNRKCVNPKHLRQDTYYSNSIDMVDNGNQSKQILSVDQVIEIKKALQYYYVGQVNDLADFYKVNNRTISSIKRGKSWSHVVI